MSDNLDAIVKQELTRVDVEEQYDEFLDECYGDVEIAGFSYTTSRSLKQVDPIAYRCGLIDFLDAQVQDDIYVLVGDDYYLANEVADLKESLADSDE
jgi:hypothetical protein